MSKSSFASDQRYGGLAHSLLGSVIAAVLFATCCSKSYANCSEYDRKFNVRPHIVENFPGFADREHPLLICNLLSDQPVRVTSLMLTADRRLFSSSQIFKISDTELNTVKDSSMGGSYAGTDPDGYLWSMTESHNPPRDMLSSLAYDPATIVIKAESQKNGTISGKLRRNFGTSFATAHDIRANGIIGKLFVPEHRSEDQPAILIIPGAGGPNFQVLAAYLLAARGFTVLSLQYYGLNGLPERLESIPIEYFSHAIDYLRRDYIGNDGKIVLLATSRGTEAAAMIALQRDDIDGLVLFSPSSVLNSAWGAGITARVPAWTLHGSPLPFMPSVEGEQAAIQAQIPPYRTRMIYDMRLDKLDPTDSARIPFHKIKGDLILLSCDQDEVWPSARMTTDIAVTAKRQGKTNVASYVFPGCGHDLGAPVAPTTGREYRWLSNGPRYTLGGTPQAAWRGQKAAWSILLKYLGVSGER
jgi:pimeloyl-ACP methyl ester carboxylesterase